MRKLVLLFFSLSVASTVIGCATSVSERETARYAADGLSVNSVRLIRGQREVISSGRLAGPVPVEVRETESIFRLPWRGNGSVELSIASDFLEAQDAVALSARLAQGCQHFSAALEAMVDGFAAFDRIDLHVQLVLAPDQSGAFMSSRSAMDEALSISLLYPLPDEVIDPEESHSLLWWSGVLANTVHELFHLHHDLSGFTSSQLNEEAAASFLENCALVRFGESIGAFPVLDVAWLAQDERAARAFPYLGDGKFLPDEEILKTEFPLISISGRALASAVLYMLSENGVIDSARREDRTMVLDYCDKLALGVPDFLSSEIY